MQFTALPTPVARAYQAGEMDVYGNAPELEISQGEGMPCRHCLSAVPKGKGMLVLAHRPFGDLQPYAETGPIYVCADHCADGSGAKVPPVLEASEEYLVKGYNDRDRIIYGTGEIVPKDKIASFAEALFEREDIAYLHVRSARNNCYLLRIDRG